MLRMARALRGLLCVLRMRIAEFRLCDESARTYTPERFTSRETHVGRFQASERPQYKWLNDSVYVHCRIIANWHVLSCKAEPLENNWALAPMDQWRR